MLPAWDVKALWISVFYVFDVYSIGIGEIMFQEKVLSRVIVIYVYMPTLNTYSK